MQTVVDANACQSKWGFHPCDHATFLKLKRLNWFAELSKRLNAQWERWSRKADQNRFRKTKTRFEGKTVVAWALDANGNRIPWLEPLSVPGNYSNDLIAENYRRARFPSIDPAQVKPLTLSVSNIDKELALIEKWYAEHKSEIGEV